MPALDEAAVLPGLLQQLQAQRGLTLELIVVDGGSRDGTAELARAAGARVIASPRGRARQLNAGAAQARADWLLFLHADSRLEDPGLLAGALAALRAAGDERRAGHFALRFHDGEPRHARFYAFLEAKSRLNRPGSIHGDQGLLIHRRFFAELGGYDERWPIMEDEVLAARVFAAGGWRLLPGTLGTSARRFEREGVGPRYALMALMMALWAAGDVGFFEEAPGLYRPPAEGQPLRLGPFWQLARRRLRALPPERRRAACRAIGRLAAGNAWQIPYFLSGQDPAWLAHHDRWLGPGLASRPVEALAGALAALVVWAPPAPR